MLEYTTGHRGGTGGTHLRAVGAGCSVVLPDECNPGQILTKATISSAVPGKQTFPRAEIWSLLLVLQVWNGRHPLTLITDATYTMTGMDLANRLSSLKGKNGDLWKEIHAEVDAKGMPTMVKVKSHSIVMQTLHRRAPYQHLTRNEFADLAAGRASDHQGP